MVSASESYRDIEEKIRRGERLSREDGVRLFHCLARRNGR